MLEARFGLKNNFGIFAGVADFQGKVLRESGAGHLMIPLLLDASWEFHDSFVPSKTVGPHVFVNTIPPDTEIHEQMTMTNGYVKVCTTTSTLPTSVRPLWTIA